ncbi:TspO/MBR-related protein [Trametopsis cervina]|nr:TspO/MBR-related protein [Trametopsis cervina]
MFILDHTSWLLPLPRNVFTAIGLPLAVGMLSGSRTKDVVKGTWYNSLYFPPGRAPGAIFPFAWTGLYIAMGYASHLAVRAYDRPFQMTSELSLASVGIALYYTQLGLNVLWTPLFFVRKQTKLALVDSALLTTLTIWMTKVLHEPTRGKSTWFLLPYCAWLSYATYLNAGIVYLNEGRSLPKDD